MNNESWCKVEEVLPLDLAVSQSQQIKALICPSQWRPFCVSCATAGGRRALGGSVGWRWYCSQ